MTLACILGLSQDVALASRALCLVSESQQSWLPRSRSSKRDDVYFNYTVNRGGYDSTSLGTRFRLA